MAQKNRYLFRGRISERKFRDLARLFALDITADRAAALTGLNHKTAAAIYTLLRVRMAELAREGCPFQGVVEVDESYFGPTRQRGWPGRGASNKTPVFGILERGGRVHCQIVKNCSKATLQAIIEGRVDADATITSDAFKSYAITASANTTAGPPPASRKTVSTSTASRASGVMPNAATRSSTACAGPAFRSSSRRPNSGSTHASRTSTRSS